MQLLKRATSQNYTDEEKAGHTNWAIDSQTVAIDNVEKHQKNSAGVQRSAASINDKEYGDPKSWSGGGGGNNGATTYASLAFAEANNNKKKPLTLLVDKIAFGRDNTGNKQDLHVGTYTIQVSKTDFCGGSCADKTALKNAVNAAETSWETIGHLIYTDSFPKDGWDRHVYKINPPVAATAIKVITSWSSIVIDELEVYGSKWQQNWQPGEAVSFLNATKIT
jgi:hypothetical protein